ncbi:MAG: hypothetical protein H0T47_21955 [Planctomycetaceae bacterium]|nr:hypothetical protein [Planctomycetaceae bacterium]
MAVSIGKGRWRRVAQAEERAPLFPSGGKRKRERENGKKGGRRQERIQETKEKHVEK